MKMRISIILMIVLLMMNSTAFSNDYNVANMVNTDELKGIARIVNNTVEIKYKNNINAKEIRRIDKRLLNDFFYYNDNYMVSNTAKYEILGNNKFVLQYVCKRLNSVKLTKYSGGIFGIGYIQNRKISFAIVNYDTGSYLILGTPIINIAY